MSYEGEVAHSRIALRTGFVENFGSDDTLALVKVGLSYRNSLSWDVLDRLGSEVAVWLEWLVLRLTCAVGTTTTRAIRLSRRVPQKRR